VEEFAAYFSALPSEELEVCYSKSLIIYACLNSHYCLAFQDPFQGPFERESWLILLMGSRQLILIRNSRCAFHLDQFALIYLNVPLLHSNRSKCVVMFDVCFVLNIICRTLLHHIKLFQMICCTPASHQAISKDLHIIAAHWERF
jgi:hypothetical protein